MAGKSRCARLRVFRGDRAGARAISVVTKRTGAHDDTIREFRIDGRGISLGEPLVKFQGMLRGVPTMVGAPDLLILPHPPLAAHEPKPVF